MQIGVVFPQIEIGSDPAAIRDYAQAAEEMGYTHILAYDHVLGAGLAHRPNWSRAYNSETPFHEVMVLFGYLAGLTQKIGLVTGVLILPQRQTVLVAKQAAEVDVLSGGRFRLGIGVGWNDIEYVGLGEDFYNRGIRSEEQITLLRKLWSATVLDYKGKWHQIAEAGINPLPVQRPLPIWLGGDSDATFRRVARLGDGWFPQSPPDDNTRAVLDRLRQYIREAGRKADEVGIEARLTLARTPENEWATYVEGWRKLGATHLAVNTMDYKLASPQAHIDTLRRVKSALGI
jgi:probable F420-dependent oxidoreductase